MNHSATRLTLLAVLSVSALTACGKRGEDDVAAGQRPDSAVTRSAEEARRDATQTAADVQQSASNAIGNASQATTDMAITAKVNAALAVDDKLKATQINVDTRDGQVTLTDAAPDTQSRERATTLASAIDGVKQVNNQLVVSKNG